MTHPETSQGTQADRFQRDMDGDISIHPDGDWVRFTDYQELLDRLTVAENQRDSWAHRTMFEQKLTEEMRAARDAAEKRASALNSDLAEIPARAWAVWNTYWKGERTTGIKTVQVMEAMLGTLENLADHFATAHAASSEPRSAEVQGETQPGAEIGPRGITGLGGVYDGEADQQDGGAKHA